jgi:hypothetical protein
VNSPQRKRKAPQTARGFKCNTTPGGRHTPVGEGRHRVVPAANSFAWVPRGPQPQHRTPRPAHTRWRRPTSRCPSREFIRLGVRAGLNRNTAPRGRHTPVGEGRHRVVPAANSFAWAGRAGLNHNITPRCRHTPVGASRHRVVPAANSFARAAADGIKRGISIPRRPPIPAASHQPVGAVCSPSMDAVCSPSMDSVRVVGSG